MLVQVASSQEMRDVVQALREGTATEDQVKFLKRVEEAADAYANRRYDSVVQMLAPYATQTATVPTISQSQPKIKPEDTIPGTTRTYKELLDALAINMTATIGQPRCTSVHLVMETLRDPATAIRILQEAAQSSAYYQNFIGADDNTFKTTYIGLLNSWLSRSTNPLYQSEANRQILLNAIFRTLSSGYGSLNQQFRYGPPGQQVTGAYRDFLALLVLFVEIHRGYPEFQTKWTEEVVTSSIEAYSTERQYQRKGPTIRQFLGLDPLPTPPSGVEPRTLADFRTQISCPQGITERHIYEIPVQLVAGYTPPPPPEAPPENLADKFKEPYTQLLTKFGELDAPPYYTTDLNNWNPPRALNATGKAFVDAVRQATSSRGSSASSSGPTIDPSARYTALAKYIAYRVQYPEESIQEEIARIEKLPKRETPQDDAKRLEEAKMRFSPEVLDANALMAFLDEAGAIGEGRRDQLMAGGKRRRKTYRKRRSTRARR
jgi:hypothetical protein